LLQAVALSNPLERRKLLLAALKLSYKGRSGRYSKADTKAKRQAEREIEQIKQGSIPDDSWIDEINRAMHEFCYSQFAQVKPQDVPLSDSSFSNGNVMNGNSRSGSMRKIL
jgi:hypothetical protein